MAFDVAATVLLGIRWDPETQSERFSQHRTHGSALCPVPCLQYLSALCPSAPVPSASVPRKPSALCP